LKRRQDELEQRIRELEAMRAGKGGAGSSSTQPPRSKK
jgi:hypothetical protein